MKRKRAFLDRSGTGEIIKATDMFVLQHFYVTFVSVTIK